MGNKICNRCGKAGLRWERVGGGFVLFDADVRHQCQLPDDVPLEIQGEGESYGSVTWESKRFPDVRPQQRKEKEATVPEKATEAFSQALTELLVKQGGDETKQLATATEQLLKAAASEAQKQAESAAQRLERQAKASQQSVNELMDKAKEDLKAEMARLVQPAVVELKIPQHDLSVSVDTNEEHKQYAMLMQLVLTGTHVFLPGQAGSGKTTAAIHLARDLKKVFQRDDYEFLTISVTEMTSESRLAGFFDAQGRLINTAFRRAYIEGHLFLLDEADAGNPNVLAFANMALSNGRAAFADGVYPMHEHFRCLVAGNTFGQGGSLIYVGRNALDGAFLDRFYFLPWTVDERLELRVARAYDPVNKEIPKWVGWVQQLRASHEKLGASAPHIVISPRASIIGAKLLATGVHKSANDPALAEALIWRGAKAEVRRKLGE